MNTDKPTPEPAPEAPKAERGLYDKFVVRRRDGRDAPGQKHDGCRYFVIDMDHDEHAKDALRAYAENCSTDLPALADDLREWLGDPPLPAPEAPATEYEFYERQKAEILRRQQPAERGGADAPLLAAARRYITAKTAHDALADKPPTRARERTAQELWREVVAAEADMRRAAGLKVSR